MILALLLTMMVFAYPSMRQKFHDRFERTHRFLGWTATALVWAQTILLINDYRIPGESLAHAVRTAVPFWLVVVLTGSIILPWTKLRKVCSSILQSATSVDKSFQVPVRAEVLSGHAVRLHFDYGNTLFSSARQFTDIVQLHRSLDRTRASPRVLFWSGMPGQLRDIRVYMRCRGLCMLRLRDIKG